MHSILIPAMLENANKYIKYLQLWKDYLNSKQFCFNKKNKYNEKYRYTRCYTLINVCGVCFFQMVSQSTERGL